MAREEIARTERRAEQLAAAYRRHVRESGNEARLVAASSFAVSFIVVRLVTHAIRAGFLQGLLFHDVVAGAVHIHHMVPGLLLVLAAGLLDLLDLARVGRALLFGIGAALILDEFALLLNLADVYWAPQGRESIDAVIVFGAVLAVVVVGGDFWRAAWRILVTRR